MAVWINLLLFAWTTAISATLSESKISTPIAIAGTLFLLLSFPRQLSPCVQFFVRLQPSSLALRSSLPPPLCGVFKLKS